MTAHETHARPPGVSDETVEALGKLSEVIGRNVLDGRWTFQIVEEFDDLYYEPIRDGGRRLLDEFVGGRRHLFEAELKEQRRTHGQSGHQRRPPAMHQPTAGAGIEDPV